MAREPGRRYPTALELAEDLRRWQRGESIQARPANPPERLWRWCRRKPLVASLAAALAVVAVGGFVAVFSQWRRAEANLQEVSRQHELAIKGLQHAREAVDQFHTHVSETKLLNEPGLQPLRLQLLETARDFYQQFIREHGETPEMQADLGKAFFRLGSITYLIGSQAKALPQLEQAVAIQEKLLADNPQDTAVEKELGRSLNNLANVYMSAGELEKAEINLQKSLAIFERLERE